MWCIVAHSSDMQDLSWHTIPRPIQDTALPLPPCHYSYIGWHTTPESSLSSLVNTDRLITIYMHHYCDTRTTPSQHHTLEHNTNTLSAISGHQRPHFSYISGLLYLHSSTLGSAVSQSYYRQIRPIAVDPDQDWAHSSLHCLCTALSYWRPSPQIFVIQSHSRYGIRTA
jgi:hypothetical protein